MKVVWHCPPNIDAGPVPTSRQQLVTACCPAAQLNVDAHTDTHSLFQLMPCKALLFTTGLFTIVHAQLLAFQPKQPRQSPKIVSAFSPSHPNTLPSFVPAKSCPQFADNVRMQQAGDADIEYPVALFPEGSMLSCVAWDSALHTYKLSFP